jgi:hypothetical protein
VTRSSTTTGLDDPSCARIFSSPVARAFVRTVVARRGITEAQARNIYLDYLNRAERPLRRRQPHVVCVK